MGKKTIMIIDDDMDNRLVLEKRLAAEGYSIITAYNGNNALSIARYKRLDLIILDSVLGDMLGEEVAARLREDAKTNNIPIIFLSALLSKEDEVEKEGVLTDEKVFTKPYDMEKLLTTIEKNLRPIGVRLMNKNISVLVIDDETDIRKVLEYNLELDGFDVYSAANGPTGLKIAREKKPDVILLDWVMPKMDGLEVLAELRDDERTKDIIVFMLTAKNMMDDVATALAGGADDYIPKPFEGAELGLRILSMFEVLRKGKRGDACESERMICLQSSEKD